MKHRGFTIIELLTVFVIISVLAMILFPVFVQTREKVLGLKCYENLKALNVALALYCDDHRGYFPPMNSWQSCLSDYAWSEEKYRCPKWTGSGSGYALDIPQDARWVPKDSTLIRLPDNLPLAFDAYLANLPSGLDQKANDVQQRPGWYSDPRHIGYSNVLFREGRVTSFRLLDSRDVEIREKAAKQFAQSR